MQPAPMTTSGSITQNSPMRTPGPITASAETRAVGATIAEGSIPGTLGHAAVAVFDAIVLIERRDRPQRFVIEALLAERFLEVLFESVKRLEVIGRGGNANSLWRAEEFLEAAIHEHADLVADQNAGALLDPHGSIGGTQVHGA